jgi:TonB family protein
MKRLTAVLACLVATTVLTAVEVRADDLAAARDLYAAAAYEEALAALDRVRATGVAPADAFAVEEYRAFCLLALGRNEEAQKAIEAMVAADPLYRPAAELSPRVRSAFSSVRKRFLPTVIPQRYAKAKAAFDSKDYATAAATFAQVLNVLADPDVAHAAGQPPLSDLRTLATGFQELSVKAILPEPPEPEPAPPVAEPSPPPPSTGSNPPAPAREPAQAQAGPGVAPRIYTALDARVVPPAPIRQDLPAFTGRLAEPALGSMEVLIDERGAVEFARILMSADTSYDRRALDATRNWRYRPAMVDGVAVKFRKIIQIAIKPGATR